MKSGHSYCPGLPIEPFRYYQYGGARTSGWLRRSRSRLLQRAAGWIGGGPVQWDGRQVRLLNPDNGQLLREHLRQARGRHRITKTKTPRSPLIAHRQMRCGKRTCFLCQRHHCVRACKSIGRPQSG